MKTNLQTLEEMVDIAVAFNPEDKQVNILDNGQNVMVTRIVKKLNSADFTLAELRGVHRKKCEQYPEFTISLKYAGREQEQ